MSKILRAQDFEALASARTGIDQAHSEADAIVAAAHEQAQAIRDEARAEAEADRAALVAEYAGAMHAQIAAMPDRMADLAMACLRRVLDPIPDAKAVAGAVAATLRETDIAGGAVLVVAPPLMHTLREQLERRGIPATVIEVRGDPECPLESSVLRSPFGDIELGIEPQLRAIERGLRAAARNGDPQGSDPQGGDPQGDTA